MSVSKISFLEETTKKIELLEKQKQALENPLKKGKISKTSAKQGRKKNYDFLVVGFRGAHAKFLGIGSIAEKILQRLPCPVLIVK